MTVSFVKRPAYFPRTPPAKSYSGNISSGSRLDRSLPLLSPFRPGCASSADDSNRVPDLRMYHDQGSIAIGPPNDYETIFFR